jgi:hypothetical protein
MAVNVNRINPRRLRTPAEINEALDAIAAEIGRLQKLQERVESRQGELVAESAIATIPGFENVVADESYADFFAKLYADAMAYRKAEAAASEPKEKKSEEKAEKSEDVFETTAEDDGGIFG